MNYGKSVEEVWEWRETFEKELNKVPHNQQVKFINESAQEACLKLGVKCKIVKREPTVESHS
jgi:hypothetical protein